MTEKAKIILGKVSFTFKGEWKEDSTYERFDVVNKDGTSYVSLTNTNTYAVLDTTKWSLLANKGDQGPVGNGLTILGYYPTLSELQSSVTNPQAGDAYGIGSAIPYDIYVYDAVNSQWLNNGQLRGESLKFSDLTEDEIKELQQPALEAVTSANAAATRLNTLCDNRDKVVEGYWWHYNESTKEYENTGEIAKGNVMYATFQVTDEARLTMTTDEEYTGANFALDEHGVLTVTL